MSDIFLSYARADRQRARLIANVLMDMGWSVWWDPQIQAGKEFDRVIEDEIKKAKCVVVLWSHHSIDSDWVRAEAAEGLRRRVMIPILIEKDLDLPLRFRQVQTIPLFAWKGTKQDPEFDKLVADIKAIVGPPSTGPTETAPDPLDTEPRQNESVHVVLPEPPASSVREGSTHIRLITATIGVIIGALFGVISTVLSAPLLRESYPSVLRSWMWQFGLIDAVAGGIVGLIVGGEGKGILWAIGGSAIGAFIGWLLAQMYFASAAGLSWGWAIGAIIAAFIGMARAGSALDRDPSATE